MDSAFREAVVSVQLTALIDGGNVPNTLPDTLVDEILANVIFDGELRGSVDKPVQIFAGGSNRREIVALAVLYSRESWYEKGQFGMVAGLRDFYIRTGNLPENWQVYVRGQIGKGRLVARTAIQ